jgi:hypothetical protein
MTNDDNKVVPADAAVGDTSVDDTLTEDTDTNPNIDRTPAKEPNVYAQGYYADDLTAEEVAGNNMDPDKVKEDEDIPVTTGDMSIGDLDEGEEPEDITASPDEENVPGGEDNVISED